MLVGCVAGVVFWHCSSGSGASVVITTRSRFTLTGLVDDVGFWVSQTGHFWGFSQWQAGLGGGQGYKNKKIALFYSFTASWFRFFQEKMLPFRVRKSRQCTHNFRVAAWFLFRCPIARIVDLLPRRMRNLCNSPKRTINQLYEEGRSTDWR